MRLFESNEEVNFIIYVADHACMNTHLSAQFMRAITATWMEQTVNASVVRIDEVVCASSFAFTTYQVIYDLF